MSHEPSNITSAELSYINRLTLQPWQAVMTFLAPELKCALYIYIENQHNAYLVQHLSWIVGDFLP